MTVYRVTNTLTKDATTCSSWKEVIQAIGRIQAYLDSHGILYRRIGENLLLANGSHAVEVDVIGLTLSTKKWENL